MADHRDDQHDIDRQLEDRLAAYRDRIAYPEMGDSAGTARLRIEGAVRAPSTPLPVSSPFDDWDDDALPQTGSAPVVDIRDSRPKGRFSRAIGMSAAVAAMLLIGEALVAVLPRVTDDDGSPAVLGPDTVGYEFAGTLGGSMIPNEPVDVALDSEGNIYAADVATRSILKFTSDGEFVSSFTAEESEVGAFIRPWSLVIEGDTIYVLDQRNVAIYQMDTDGNILDSWHIGDPDDRSQIFSGIDVNQHGHIYTANTNAGTIAIFEGDGTPLAQISVTDDPDSGGERPLDVAVNSAGVMYVTSYAGETLSVFDPTGTQIDRWTHIAVETTMSGTGGLYGVTVAPSGDLYLSSEKSVVRVAPDGRILKNWSIETTLTAVQLLPPGDVAVDSKGSIVIPDPHNRRIVVLDDEGNSTLEITESRTNRFALPGGMDVGTDGSLYIADSTAQRVTRFAADGEPLDQWSWSTDTGPRIGRMPGDVTLTENNVYVLDGIAEAMVKLTLDAEKLLEWTTMPLDEDAWSGPRGILSDSHGDLYLIDWQNPRILKYDEDGQFLGDWSAISTGAERQTPRAMAIHGDVIYVAFTEGSTPGIWTLDLDGNVIDQVVEFVQDNDGNLETFVVGIAVAPTGDVFTIDPFARTVRWYSSDGALRSELEIGDASTPGQFVDIAVSDTGTVYVSDAETRQILVFEPVSSRSAHSRR